MENMNGDPQTN